MYKYDDLTNFIIESIGGKENIKDLKNCMTRLRFDLKKTGFIDEKKLKEKEGILGVVNNPGEYQIIVGTNAEEICKEIHRKLALSNQTENSKEMEKGNEEKRGNIFTKLIKTISSCILPSIVALAGTGVIKGILAACVGFGIMTTDSGTYQVLYNSADTLLYFFPIFVAFNASKVFDMNPTVAGVIGATLVAPNLISAENLTFFGISIPVTDYTYTLFPSIVAIWFASHIEKFLKKHSPEAVKVILPPTITILITVPMTYFTIGPVMNYATQFILKVMSYIFTVSPSIAGIFLGAFWNLIVLFGIHQALIPLILQEILTNGFSYMDASITLAIWGIAGMALGYALANKKDRQMGLNNFIIAVLGTGEPATYGIALPNIKNFVCAMIGSGVGGFIMAFMGAKTYGVGAAGIFSGAFLISPDGFDANFVYWVVSVLVAVTISAVLTFIVNKRDNKEAKNV